MWFFSSELVVKYLFDSFDSVELWLVTTIIGFILITTSILVATIILLIRERNKRKVDLK